MALLAVAGHARVALALKAAGDVPALRPGVTDAGLPALVYVLALSILEFVADVALVDAGEGTHLEILVALPSPSSDTARGGRNRGCSACTRRCPRTAPGVVPGAGILVCSCRRMCRAGSRTSSSRGKKRCPGSTRPHLNPKSPSPSPCPFFRGQKRAGGRYSCERSTRS